MRALFSGLDTILSTRNAHLPLMTVKELSRTDSQGFRLKIPTNMLANIKMHTKKTQTINKNPNYPGACAEPRGRREQTCAGAGRRMREATCGRSPELGPSSSCGGCYSSCGALARVMDFENLFSKPPNPALGKKPTTDFDERWFPPSFHALIAGAPVGFRLLVPFGGSPGRVWATPLGRAGSAWASVWGQPGWRGGRTWRGRSGAAGTVAGHGARFVRRHGQRCRDPASGDPRGPGSDRRRLPFPALLTLETRLETSMCSHMTLPSTGPSARRGQIICHFSLTHVKHLCLFVCSRKTRNPKFIKQWG